MVEFADGPMAEQGIKTAKGNIGGRQKTPFGSVKFFPAAHGSGVPGALACGYVFEIGGKKIYHAGDTGLIAEMGFLADEKIDAALLPIGDFFTMGPEDAVKAAEMIAPKLVIPMHYDTFPVIKQTLMTTRRRLRLGYMQSKGVVRPVAGAISRRSAVKIFEEEANETGNSGFRGGGRAFVDLLVQKRSYLINEGLDIKVNYVLNSRGSIFTRRIDCASLIEYSRTSNDLSQYKNGGSEQVNFESIMN